MGDLSYGHCQKHGDYPLTFDNELCPICEYPKEEWRCNMCCDDDAVPFKWFGGMVVCKTCHKQLYPEDYAQINEES